MNENFEHQWVYMATLDSMYFVAAMVYESRGQGKDGLKLFQKMPSDWTRWPQFVYNFSTVNNLSSMDLSLRCIGNKNAFEGYAGSLWLLWLSIENGKNKESWQHMQVEMVSWKKPLT